MQAFHNDGALKSKYIKRVKEHQEMDQIIKGTYWNNGKGCAVGCTIHSSNHNAYEIELGIPAWLAYVEDSLFEGMSIEESKKWPFRFLNAIKVGGDLDKLKAPFQIIVLKHCLNTLNNLKFNDNNFPKVIKCIEESKDVVQEAIHLWNKYSTGPSAASAASAASADSAASAAWAARAASAASAASADSAASAASADSAASAASAAWAAREKTFEYFADELIKLIEDGKDICNENSDKK